MTVRRMVEVGARGAGVGKKGLGRWALAGFSIGAAMPACFAGLADSRRTPD